MNNVISWADAVKALKAIADEQQLVSGMSVAEAASALKYTKTASGMYLKTVMTTGAESIAGATATEVATTAATEAATTTAVNLTLVEGAGGVAEVAGIGTIALPIAACVGAATAGYLIGNELNKIPAYSDFFDHLVYTIGDFVTGQHLADTLDENNTITTSVLYDANGRAYLPSDMIGGIKTYLDSFITSSGVGYSSIDEVCSHFNITDKSHLLSTTYACVFTGVDYVAFIYSTDSKAVHLNSINRLQLPYGAGYTQVVYSPTGNYMSTNVSAGGGTVVLGTTTYVCYSNYDILNDNDGSIYYAKNEVVSTLPEPVTKYTPSTTLPTITKTDPNGKTWSRVFLPSTSPSEMPDGEPVPEVEPSPSRITPYIAPTQPQPAEVPIVIPSTTPINPIVIPNPEPNTSTAPYPSPDPANDPSQLADSPAIEATEPLPQPVNTGSPTVPLVPSAPLPTSAKGLLHVYNPTALQVDAFGEWLWTTFSGDLIDTIGKLFNNPMDAVIGLHEIYCTPTESATDVNIRAGFLESNVASRLVTERYIEIKCGALSVPEYWGNYLDYSPYTKSYCYLPFIGIVELNTDDIVGSGVEITYRVDVYNGSCIALITTAKPNSAESVTYQFEGNCSVSVPITSGMMTAVQNALIGVATTALGAAATAAVTVATGGTALPAAVMLGSVAAGSAQHGLTSKNQVQYSGSFGSSYGAMGIKKPFLIIKRPRQKVVYGYNTNYGYPAHKMVLVSTCTGYLKAREVDVVSPTATEAEKKMIEQLLKSGVFVD